MAVATPEPTMGTMVSTFFQYGSSAIIREEESDGSRRCSFHSFRRNSPYPGVHVRLSRKRLMKFFSYLVSQGEEPYIPVVHPVLYNATANSTSGLVQFRLVPGCRHVLVLEQHPAGTPE